MANKVEWTEKKVDNGLANTEQNDFLPRFFFWTVVVVVGLAMAGGHSWWRLVLMKVKAKCRDRQTD